MRTAAAAMLVAVVAAVAAAAAVTAQAAVATRTKGTVHHLVHHQLQLLCFQPHRSPPPRRWTFALLLLLR
jgi:hypothetical protein